MRFGCVIYPRATRYVVEGSGGECFFHFALCPGCQGVEVEEAGIPQEPLDGEVGVPLPGDIPQDELDRGVTLVDGDDQRPLPLHGAVEEDDLPRGGGGFPHLVILQVGAVRLLQVCDDLLLQLRLEIDVHGALEQAGGDHALVVEGEGTIRHFKLRNKSVQSNESPRANPSLIIQSLSL